MKRAFFLAFLLSLSLTPSVFADSEAQLDQRIESSRKVLAAAMASSDESIPEELLAKAKAIAVYPSTLNAAFIFGGRYGRGIVISRTKDGGWGPVAFSTIGGGSFGLQAGGQATDIILVILNDRGLNGVLSDSFTLGANASVAAGPVGRKHEVGTDLFLQAAIISYARSVGIFAGVALDGAVMTQDNQSNSTYYGKSVGSREILQGNAVEPKGNTVALIKDLEDYSARWGKRGGSGPAVYDRPAQADIKPDLTGLLTSVDMNEGEIVVMTDRPEGQKTGQAEVRVQAERTVLAGLKTGDRVQVYLDGQGKGKHAFRVVRER
ncbi:MAG TPA: lipid-binding SYLF domain-containing protein [Candidatus Eisenbacteria bacterium]|jgi:lipid-binding SYLF domain-containing protein|nr:lipid-binding SYLF domain-containing protein [Candidatus Eisenbacteria bacterium]